jgi:hypothetical protein
MTSEADLACEMFIYKLKRQCQPEQDGEKSNGLPYMDVKSVNKL